MARILLIEDEQDLREAVAYNLKQAGYEVLVAANGREGMKIAEQSAPNLVLLDLMLPDMSGMDVCRALKANPATWGIPILMVTAKGEEVDRVVGFELGAEDYVVKPFSVRELILRIQAVLRRMQGERPKEEAITFGRMMIRPGAHRVRIDGDEVELTALEFKLLLSLYESRGRVRTRANLLDDVWGMSAETNTRTIDTHVKRLREKIGAAAEYIETVRGVGYRMRDDVDTGDSHKG